MNFLAEKIKSIEIERAEAQKRDYIGASQVGHPCLRHLWYAWQQEFGFDESALQKRIFAVGRHFESLVREWIEKALLQDKIAVSMGAELFDADIPEFRGTPDLVATRNDNSQFLIEIKTANHSNFQQFSRNGLLKWMPKYYSQLQAYMGMSDIHESHLIAMDKDTSDLYSEQVFFDKEYYEELKIRVKSILSSQSVPPRMHENPMFYMCRGCSYRDICHLRDN